MNPRRDRRVITLGVEALPENATLMSAVLRRPANRATILWQALGDTATLVVNDFISVIQPSETSVDETIDYPNSVPLELDVVSFIIEKIDGPIYSLRMSAEGIATGATLDILVE